MDTKTVLLKLRTNPKKGLSTKEALIRLESHGYNEIEERISINILKILANQVNSPLVWLLVAAAFLSFLVGEQMDAALILIIVILNTILGFLQEYKAEKAMESLRSMLQPVAKVVRDGRLMVIPARELVPGDLIVLQEGDRVPADARLLEADSLLVDESLLTGESVPVEKNPEWWGNAPLSERRNVLYAGTTVVRGRAKAVVYATGKDTEMGKIATEMRNIEDEKTVFEVEMERIANTVGKVTIIVAGTVMVAYLVSGMSIVDALTASVALAVAAVPEGLPVVVTLAISLGVLEMARKKALVRKLRSVEVLGSVDVICTDKTGTITLNRMKVVEWWGDERWIKWVSACCVDVDRESGVGDPLELALVEFGGDVNCKVLEVIPFSPERKMMSTVVEMDGGRWILTKGAPEKIAELTGSEELMEVADRMAEKGLRVIALAYKEYDGRPEERPYRLAGVVGLLDPPRKEVIEAIYLAKKAGVRTIMITGDHPKTALQIAKMVGIEGTVVTGRELDEMTDDELERIVENVAVFARVEPLHKLRIVRALQRRGHVVAMTGDGVNDAPALKAADVGIALGNGTDVAKEASDIILLDNNYTTIVEAVKEGRRILDNIKKFVIYLLSANTGEVMGVFLASLAGKLLLKPVHLLLLNILTDGAPAVALASDPARRGLMERPPRKKSEPLLTKDDLLLGVGVIGALLGVLVLGIFLSVPESMKWSAVLLAFVLAEMVRLQVVREEPITNNRWLLISIGASILIVVMLIYTPVGRIFDLRPLGLREIGFSLLGIVLFYLAYKVIKVAKRHIVI